MASDTNVSSASLENQVSAVVARVDMLVGEMRQQNAMRANEIAEIRQAIQSMQTQNIFVIIGVVAIAVAVFLK